MSASSWTDPFAAREPLYLRGLRFLLILAGHLAVLWAGVELAARPEVQALAKEISVRLLEEKPPIVEAKPEPPPPPPKPRQPVRQKTPPPPIMAVAPEAPAPAVAFTVPPQPPPPPEVAPIAPPAPAPVVTAARFDADYLSNPKPVYPPASRRLGEEGRVLLRVHVSAEGEALAVHVKHTCGFSRLDEAARAAVQRWRFVPARRGSEAIESWVAVPIVFSLQTS